MRGSQKTQWVVTCPWWKHTAQGEASGVGGLQITGAAWTGAPPLTSKDQWATLLSEYLIPGVGAL